MDRHRHAVTGGVILYVLRKPSEGGGPGAQDVDLVDLSGSTPGSIGEFDITGDLGADGPLHTEEAYRISVGGDVINGIAIDGDVWWMTVGGDVLGPVNVDRVLQRLTVGGNVDAAFNLFVNLGPVTIGGLLRAPFECLWAGADINLQGTGTHTGDIVIWGADDDATLAIAGSHSGRIQHHELHGRIECLGAAHELIVDRSILDGASIFVGLDLDLLQVGTEPSPELL